MLRPPAFLGAADTMRIPGVIAGDHGPEVPVPVGSARRRRAVIALLVFAGYYIGARIGLAFTFEPNPISVLWPPNSILFAALLLTARRDWWVVLFAALPAHLLVELQSGVPVAMVLCWYASNVVEALIGATVLRAFAPGLRHLQTIRSVVAFIAASILAPFLSSFLDSAFVTLVGWGQADYWQLWETRFFANVLTALTIVPLIVTWANDGVATLRSVTRRRAGEAGILLAILAVISIMVFDSTLGADGPLVLLYLPLPFLLWAALRFGTAGASTSFALVAFLVIWGAGHSLGQFGTGTPAENAFSVQLFLIFVGPLLLCLAALSSERDAARRRLRDSEQRFATAFRSSPVAMSIARQADGRIVEVNDRWELLFGCCRSEAVGRTVVDVGRIRPGVRDEIKTLVLAQGRVAHIEIDIFDARGEVRHVVMASEAVEMDGEPCHIANFTDVTERRRTEELNQRLAHASRLTAMGEMTASIAHEINQPISAILSNVDAAEMLLDSGVANDDELRQILEDIRRDDLRASEVIRHVRGLATKRQAEIQPFDLNELIGSVLRLVAPVAQQRNVTVTTSYGDLPGLNGDRIHVQQVLLNLIFNAMDAMAETPDGRRALAVRTTDRGADGVEVAVCDNGHGIPPDRLETIFHSFFTTKKEGMGLGLSIALTLVEAHGGRIWAENNAGGGATLRFTLRTSAPSVAA